MSRFPNIEKTVVSFSFHFAYLFVLISNGPSFLENTNKFPTWLSMLLFMLSSLGLHWAFNYIKQVVIKVLIDDEKDNQL